ncbi:MAG: LCP family protein [Anaerolineaceae bacterium]|nr:LCP family protein [Anaerolineaceae bacterium]
MAQQNMQMARPPGSKKQKPKSNFNPMTLILMVVFIGLAITAGVVGFNIVRNFVQGWSMTDLPGLEINNPKLSGEEVPENFVPEGEEFEIPLQSPDDLEPEPWDGASRVTVLVLGLDYRDWESNEIPRSDTMILFTMDPVEKTAGMLSIPRDMWVNIPGFGYAKINTAYFLGEGNKLPGGGPALAVETVEQFLGVPINYYAQVDFMAFVEFIDEIGGVDIHVKQEVYVDPIGDPEPFWIREGVQTFDGITTLAYARARHTEGGDFDRSARQQEVIMAVRDNILKYYSLPKLVARAPAIYDTLKDGIRTNMSLSEALQFAWLIQQIDLDNIKKAVIGPGQVSFGTSPDGLSIVKPIPDKIRIIRDEIFTSGGPTGPVAVNGDITALLQEESARISIQNGTLTPGLATRTSEYLISQGLTIVEESNAEYVHEASQMIIYNGKPYSAQYLADLLQISSDRIINQYNPDANTDLIIILGNDWANNNPMP